MKGRTQEVSLEHKESRPLKFRVRNRRWGLPKKKVFLSEDDPNKGFLISEDFVDTGPLGRVSLAGNSEASLEKKVGCERTPTDHKINPRASHSDTLATSPNATHRQRNGCLPWNSYQLKENEANYKPRNFQELITFYLIVYEKRISFACKKALRKLFVRWDLQ